ncbi:hypothetical protein F2Q68_00041013 [Brassica cretica]|uniref:Hexosyltransferase n=1 Tax=Brassica cretica TaxID=69181 RepID=A0A8S9MHE1_BRACR|nr:hypothetical protein F2Q68_00041013 [Brassica cretica]
MVEPYIPSSKWNLLVHRRFVLHTLEAGGKEFCFYGSRRQRAGRFHEDRVVKVNLVVGPHFIHSVLCLAKDQDLAFSGKLTKLGCVPLGVAAGGCVRVILSAVGWFVLIMVQKGSVVSAGSALNHSVAKLSSSCSGCNDLSSLRCKVDVSAFMPYPRDVWIMKRSFWSGCEVVVLSYEWGWPILHKYANEDVTLGSWFLGLEVEHIDDRNFCCGTPPVCEMRAEVGDVCVASFDWKCSGVCKSVDRMWLVHAVCGEGDQAVWDANL